MPPLQLACSVCFGAAGTPLADGAIAGVLVLGAIILAVLTWITLMARFWIRRARALEEAESAATEVRAGVVGSSPDGVVLYLGSAPGGSGDPLPRT